MLVGDSPTIGRREHKTSTVFHYPVSQTNEMYQLICIFSSRTCIYFFFVEYHVFVVDASEILLLCWYGKMVFHVLLKNHPIIYLSKVNQPPDGWSPNLDGLFEGHCPLTEDMKEKVHLVFASLFTDRAISYRHDRGENSPKRPKGKLHCWVPTSQSC